jgi:glycosyltransferase involved in cell wall biosynthesis
MPAYSFGGAPRVAYDIGKQLAKHNHQVTVFTTDAMDPYSRIPTKNPVMLDEMAVYYFRNLSMNLVRNTNLFMTPSIFSAVRTSLSKFDIIHLHEFRTFQNTVIHHYAKKLRVPYILQVHGQIPFMKKKESLKKIYDLTVGYRLLQDASALIALNRDEYKQYERMGGKRNDIAIVPNGIDLSQYEKLPRSGAFKQKFGIDSEKKIILFVGRIAYQKGVDILVKAYAHLVKNLKVSNSLLVLVGPDDGYLNKIRMLINSLNLKDAVLITGRVSVQEKLSALKDAEVLVLPSRYEAFPITALEAFACGKPVIASRIGGLEEIIERIGGVLFESENTQQLAFCIFNLLKNYDAATKTAMASQNFVKENFSIQAVADIVERIYKETIETSKKQ